MQKIIDWLQSEKRQWDQGVELYEQYGQNKHLLRQFKNLGDTQILRQHLEYQLAQLADVQPIHKPQLPKATATITQAIPNKQPADVKQDTPAEIQEAFAARASRHNDRAKLSNSLRTFAQDDNAGRNEVCEQIEVLSAAINQYNELINYWEQHKTLPTVEPTETSAAFVMPDDKTEQMKLLHNLRSQRSKAKRKLEKIPATHPDAIGIEKKIADLARHIQDIEKAIAGT